MMGSAAYLLAHAHPELGQALVLGAHVFMAGAATLRPHPGLPGRLYFAADVDGGTLYRDAGAAWVPVAPGLGAVVLHSLAAARGDLLAASGAGLWVSLPVGTDGQVLTADSAQPTGLAWV